MFILTKEKIQKAKDSHSHATHIHYLKPKKTEKDPEIAEKLKQNFRIN